MKKIIIGIIVTSLVVFSFYTINPAKQGNPVESEKPIVKIGFIYPMSGNAAFFGDGAKNAAKMFFEDVKKPLKNNYEIIFEDSQAQPAISVKAAMKLISFDKADVLIDCMSGVSAAVSKIAEDHKTPHLAFAPYPKAFTTGGWSLRKK